MGWGNCGFNEKIKKWMGYANEGICAVSGCGKEIDHGLSYVCGGMHEGGECGCGDYFCSEHLTSYENPETGDCFQVCFKCCEELEKYDKEESLDGWDDFLG